MTRSIRIVAIGLAWGVTLVLSAEVGHSWEKEEFHGHGFTVIRTRLAPHQKTDKHRDPGRYQIIITDGDIRSTGADGVSRDIHLSKGASAWTEPMTHTSENIGSTPYEQIDIIPDR